MQQHTITLFPYTTLFRSSEAPNLIAALKKTDHDPTDPEKMASCGKPVGCAEVALLDDNDHEVPMGEVGERSEEHTSELQSRGHIVCRLLLEKKQRQSDVV